MWIAGPQRPQPPSLHTSSKAVAVAGKEFQWNQIKIVPAKKEGANRWDPFGIFSAAPGTEVACRVYVKAGIDNDGTIGEAHKVSPIKRNCVSVVRTLVCCWPLEIVCCCLMMTSSAAPNSNKTTAEAILSIFYASTCVCVCGKGSDRCNPGTDGEMWMINFYDRPSPHSRDAFYFLFFIAPLCQCAASKMLIKIYARCKSESSTVLPCEKDTSGRSTATGHTEEPVSAFLLRISSLPSTLSRSNDESDCSSS